jgi:hypothetical protein
MKHDGKGENRRIFNDGLTRQHITEVTYFKREQLSIAVLLGGKGRNLGG